MSLRLGPAVIMLPVVIVVWMAHDDIHAEVVIEHKLHVVVVLVAVPMSRSMRGRPRLVDTSVSRRWLKVVDMSTTNRGRCQSRRYRRQPVSC